jgi:hypothetical protein
MNFCYISDSSPGWQNQLEIGWASFLFSFLQSLTFQGFPLHTWYLSLYLSAHLIIHPTIQSPSNCLPVHILALSNIVVEFYIAADFQENPNWNFDVSKDLCLEFVTVTSATCYLSKQVTRIAQIQWENEWISFLPGGVTWISKDGKKVPSLKEIHYVKRAK